MPKIAIEYFKADTCIHRLHPLTKIVFELAVFVVAAVFTDLVFLSAILLIVILTIVMARIPPQRLKYMWVIFGVAAFFIITQGVWFTTLGLFGGRPIKTHILFYLIPPLGPIKEGMFPFTLEGGIYGLSLSLRLLAISLAFPILVMTTHPSDLLLALTKIKILGKRIPYNIAFTFVTALRYVPTISREFDMTIDAQTSRGVEMGGRNPIKSFKAIAPILAPVVVSSMLRAQQLTIALETRAFGTSVDRTFLREVHFRTIDKVLVGLMIAAMIVSAIAALLGYGQLIFEGT